ncbi:TolC family protein [Niabella sp. W65]|nr:TolC family protein [Niabella sp. W65]MCH7366874.1 TolC family protein [Niabella sp. W65]
MRGIEQEKAQVLKMLLRQSNTDKFRMSWKNEADIQIAKRLLQTLLNTTDDISIADTALVVREELLAIDGVSTTNNPIIQYLQQEINVSQREISLQRSKMLPDIILGYNGQTYKGLQTINGVDRTYTGKDRFSFFQVGISIPLFPGGYKSQINAAKINEQIAQKQVELTTTNLNGQLKELAQQYVKFQKSLNYYQTQALPQADLIISNSDKSFRNGDISYTQYLQNLTLSNNIHSEYIDNLYNLNRVIISIEAILGNN